MNGGGPAHVHDAVIAELRAREVKFTNYLDGCVGSGEVVQRPSIDLPKTRCGEALQIIFMLRSACEPDLPCYGRICGYLEFCLASVGLDCW